MLGLDQIYIYHILHIDKLESILRAGAIFCDKIARERYNVGTRIGMQDIKNFRLTKPLISYPDLMVGSCTPFYFCPRSVMLFIIYKGDHPNLDYKGGQFPILHIVANFNKTIDWANANCKRWVFTNVNARAKYAEDFNQIKDLDKIDWEAVNAQDWREKKEHKQAEFLVEGFFPIQLIESIGVYNAEYQSKVMSILAKYSICSINVPIMKDWYYQKGSEL